MVKRLLEKNHWFHSCTFDIRDIYHTIGFLRWILKDLQFNLIKVCFRMKCQPSAIICCSLQQHATVWIVLIISPERLVLSYWLRSFLILLSKIETETTHNRQKWKNKTKQKTNKQTNKKTKQNKTKQNKTRRFLTCQCHKIFKGRSSCLFSFQLYFKNYDFCEYRMWNLWQFRENLIFCQLLLS